MKINDYQKCLNSQKWFRTQSQPRNPQNTPLSTFFIWMILIMTIFGAQSSRVKTPLGWQAQTGIVSFTTTSLDTYTDARFSSTFQVTLQILQLQGQEYRIILALGKVDSRFSPTTTALPLSQITANPAGDSNVNTVFTIQFYIEDQTLLTSVKANYLLIGAYLKSNSLMMGSQINVNLGAGRCDGLLAQTTCTYVKGVPFFSTFMDMTKYKIFLSISGYSLYSDSTTTVTPYTTTGVQSKFQLKYTNFVSTASNVITVTVTVDKVSMSLVSFYVVSVHLDMFDPTKQLGTMLLEYSKIMTAAGTQQGTFVQKVNKNYWMGLNSFKGPKWSFDLYQSNPANFKLNVRLFDSSTYLHVHGFVIFGFTDECKTRRSCRACYVPPNYECTECQKNFIPTTPPNSVCRCPSPYKQISGICDIVPLGCIVATRLPDASIQCHQCNIAKKLVINTDTNSCDCIEKFVMGTNNVCTQVCGDGFRVVSQCDDGNNQAGDGCSPNCKLENGFICDVTVEPTKCHSTAPLIYEIESIIKIENDNSGLLKLRLKNEFNYPFPVYKQEMQPVQDLIKLETVISLSPYNKINITDIQMTNIDESKVIELKFSYNVTVQNTAAMIHLNYNKTYYLDYIQTLQFTLKGENKPLRFQSRIGLFQNIGSGMLVGALVSMLLLIVGLMTPKFIGLETIITLQLIFFSQILIFDNSKFPVGFLFLQNFQYTAGFNHIFDFSEYNPVTDASRKMFTIKRQKLIIQNFSINFSILLLCFTFLMVTCFIRKFNEDRVLQSKEMTVVQEKGQAQKQKAPPSTFNPTLRKANQIAFYISNQVSFWLFLPLMSAISAAFCIQNFTLAMREEIHFLYNKQDEIICILTSFMIFGIVMSNFSNMWLSNISMKDINDRPQELKYKREFLGYLMVIGMYIFFMNDMDSDGVYCSVVVLMIQVAHMMYIYLIDPYKQSLKVHTVGLLFNNFVYLAFLIVINVINYSEDTQSDVTLGLGYTIVACCFVSVIITIVRLYYELKYGKELEEKLRQERLKLQQEELLRKQLQAKMRKQKIQTEAEGRLSARQKLRQKNVYLFENQLKEDQKKDLVNWLDQRPLLDEKGKDFHYFKNFPEKPLNWLQKNDKEKYEAKVQEINEHNQKNKIKETQIHENNEHQMIVCRLKREVSRLKQKAAQKMDKHNKKMLTDNNYAMSIMKEEKEKLFQKSYSLKKQ